MADRPIHPIDVIDGIARAIVTTSNVPLLLLSDDLIVVAASRSFCRSFGIERAEGRSLTELGHGEWDVPQLTGLLLATASSPVAVENYQMDLALAGREVINLVINAHRLAATAEQPVMVLLSVQDVTESEKRELLNDKLVREKTVMLAELQHRVANSLQIIASVLLQSARRTQTSERSHIVDAHNRVMSVAALQQQLAISAAESVDMRNYFTNLCRSVGASMIQDREKLRIDVDVDDSFMPSSVSLSLGLMVTELLINALKHAYPGGRGGVIAVTFRSDQAGWRLSIRDDGVGMPKPPREVTAGLGTSIIRALATQVDAEIEVTDARPGTSVVIAHRAAIDQIAPLRTQAV